MLFVLRQYVASATPWVIYLSVMFISFHKVVLVAGQRLTSQWHIGDWGPCDAACGGGAQRRQLHCIDRNGQMDEVRLLCSSPLPDVALRRACNEEPCGIFYFGLGPWGNCSTACGGGIRTRSEACMTEGGFPASSSELCAGVDNDNVLSAACNTAPCPQVSAYGRTCKEGYESPAQ